MAADIDLLFAVPLDCPMYVELQVLGSSETVTLKSSVAKLEFPRVRNGAAQTEGPLEPPSSAVQRLTHHVETWGYVRPSGRGMIAEVEQVLFVVQARAELPFDLGSDQIQGTAIDRFRQEIHSWVGSFVNWVWALTSQSLDLSHPDPKLMHRRSTNIVHVGLIGDVSSFAASGSPPLVIVAPSNGQCSERAMDDRVLGLAVKRAGVTRVPLGLELLASARMACRSGDRRRALIDIGTAAEAALAAILRLPPADQRPLGGLVRLARKRGLNIPSDAELSLTGPRNDAVHRGLPPPYAVLSRALEITEQLLAQVEPDLVPVSSLRAVHRPQRQDLILIQGPRRQG